MKFNKLMIFLIPMIISEGIIAQEKGIKELDFLIGTWETREENKENGYWETSIREIKYTLKENYILIKSNSIDFNGRKREYNWYINFNKKSNRFEMVSMFSNWHKTQFDVLEWDKEKRTLII